MPGKVLWAALLGAGLGVMNHVLGKAVRDTLFLATYPVSWLPYAFLLTGLASAIAVAIYTRLSTRLSPRRVVPALGILAALLYPAIYVVNEGNPRLGAGLLYGWVSVTGGLLVSGFWTMLSDRFDPRSGRRLYGLVGGASTLGGLLAGVGSHLAVERLEPETLILFLSAINIAMAFALFKLGGAKRRKPAPSNRRSEPEGMLGGLITVGRTAYLRNIALLVVTITIAGTLADYVLKDAAASSLTDKRALAEFFSLFHGAVGAVTLGVQLLLARPLVARRGLMSALLALPAWMFLAGAAVLINPVLGAASALRGGENAVRNSFHRSGYELLFIPMSAAERRVSKPILDTLLERMADALGALVVIALIGVAGLAASSLSWVICAFSVVAAALVVAVQRGYVKTLSTNLVSRAVELEELAGAADDDATAREAIRTTLVDQTRQDLLAELQKSHVGQSLMQSLHLEALPKGLEALRKADREIETSRATRSRGHNDPVIELMAAMADSNPEVARKALRQWDGRDRRPVPVLIRLLARQEVYKDVIGVLSKQTNRIVGTLADHLTDASESFAVRRRIPRVLSAATNQVAADALMGGLADARFEVRYHCAAALRRICSRKRDEKLDVVVDEERIWRAVREEVKKSRPMWEAQRVLDEPDGDDEQELAEALEERGAHSLKHVFNLLSLVLDTEPIQLAYRAVLGDDQQIRGVGLEYLENVVPHDVRAALWPLIGDDEPSPLSIRGKGRRLEEVMKELNASLSGASLPLVEAVRKQIEPTE